MKFLRLVIAMAILGPFLAGCTGGPAWNGPKTAHFNGSEFRNSEPTRKGAVDLMRFGWGSLSDAEKWPDRIEVPQRQVPEQRVDRGISVTCVNHATFLIQVDGVNILTDPIYSERASPFQWAGPARVHQPGIAFEDLPPIDVILISHNHYDHLDEGTLRRFSEFEQQPLIVSGLGNGALFESWGLRRHQDLDWEENLEFAGVEITFAECRHRSGRGMTDQMKTLWGAFAVRSRSGSVYIAGDSGYGPNFKDTGDRHGPFSLALLPIGAYEPRWFMADVHVNPGEAVQAHLDLRAGRSIGMHFGTFQLTYEKIDQPQQDLAVALANMNMSSEDFSLLSPGESALIVPAETPHLAQQKRRYPDGALPQQTGTGSSSSAAR